MTEGPFMMPDHTDASGKNGAKLPTLELPQVSDQRSLERALENIAKAEALDGRPRSGKFLILSGQLYGHSAQS
jgi:hypothetical protein